MKLSFSLLATAALMASSASTCAAIQRTFVKSTAVDNLACTLATPCRSFAAAILQTLPGGEVIVLDSAGYGPVTITQSVSIIAPPGVYAGISVPSGVGVSVTGTGITVVLQGLTINGTGGGTGISLSGASELYVINCSIADMSAVGIDANTSGATLFVSDTTFRDNTMFGAFVVGTVIAVFDRVRVEGTAGQGIFGAGGASVSVRDSVVLNNVLGVNTVARSGTTTRITVDNTLIADHGSAGVGVNVQDAGSSATLDVIRSTMTRSNPGYGAALTATAPATAVMTIVGSVLSENALGGIKTFGTGTGVAFASGNTFARNVSGGLVQTGTPAVHTRNNNAGEQSPPTSGTVTAVPGF